MSLIPSTSTLIYLTIFLCLVSLSIHTTAQVHRDPQVKGLSGGGLIHLEAFLTSRLVLFHEFAAHPAISSK